MIICDHTPGLTFDEEKHEYFLNGQLVPGVTTLLDRAGIIPPECKQWWTPESSQRGIDVHLAIHYHHTGGVDRSSLREEIIPYFEAYLKFERDMGFELFDSEMRLANREWGIAGTLDLAGWLTIAGRRRFAILDNKSGPHRPRWHWAQLMGYRTIFNSCASSLGIGPQETPDYFGAINLLDDGTYRLRQIDLAQIRDGQNAFNAALVCYNFNREK